jgi:hypothetical protein
MATQRKVKGINEVDAHKKQRTEEMKCKNKEEEMDTENT